MKLLPPAPLPKRLEELKVFLNLTSREVIDFKRNNANDFEELYKLLPKKKAKRKTW